MHSNLSGRSAISVLIVLAALLCAGIKLSSQTPADWDWAGKHFNHALDILLPIRRNIGGYVGYRSYRDLYTDVLEYSFVMGHDPKEKEVGLQDYVSAHVREADTVSIYDQLMKMHLGNPMEDAVSLESKVKVKSWDLTEKTCPLIRVQFKKFQQLRFKTPRFDVVVIHPLVHQFHVSAGAGDMDLALADEKNSLVAWALKSRSVLEACTAGLQPPRQGN